MTIIQLQIEQDNITDELLKVLKPYSQYFSLKKYTKSNKESDNPQSDFVNFFRNSPLQQNDINLQRDNETYIDRIGF
jgi:hypothetical protein